MYVGEEDPLKRYAFEEEPYEDGVHQIHRLAVDEELQKHGYGKCIMYIYLTFAQIKGYEKIIVNNHCENVPDFYSRFKWGGKDIEETP